MGEHPRTARADPPAPTKQYTPRTDRKGWPTAVYRDFETLDADDRAHYASLTPAERIGIMIALLSPEHGEQRPYELLGSLVARRVEFLMVGAWAMACHGEARRTAVLI